MRKIGSSDLLSQYLQVTQLAVKPLQLPHGFSGFPEYEAHILSVLVIDGDERNKWAQDLQGRLEKRSRILSSCLPRNTSKFMKQHVRTQAVACSSAEYLLRTAYLKSQTGKVHSESSVSQ